MFVRAYRAKFHDSSHYTTQLLGIEDEKIRLFMKDLNTYLLVLTIYMNSIRKTINMVNDYVIKVEKISQVGQKRC